MKIFFTLSKIQRGKKFSLTNFLSPNKKNESKKMCGFIVASKIDAKFDVLSPA